MMRKFLLLSLLMSLSILLPAQTIKKDTMTIATTTGIIDPRETKSGYQINEYYIELSAAEVKKYAGKKVEVTGTLLIVGAIDPDAIIKTQGATSDRYFIKEPKIKIIE
jgi:hypothetical protein